MTRPRNYTIAAILQFAVSVMAVILGAMSLTPGSGAAEGVPFPVVLFAFAAGVLGLVSAYGVWRNQRWGVILTILLRALDGAAAAPGMMAAPTDDIRALATFGVVSSILIIVLLLWPKPAPATA